MLLNAIAEIFATSAGTLRPSQIDVIGRLLNELMVDADTATIAALGATACVVRRRAGRDNRAVGAKRRHHDRRTSANAVAAGRGVHLGGCSRSKSQTHLLAVAIRPQLAADIRICVATRGDEVAVRYLANNQSAQISESQRV